VLTCRADFGKEKSVSLKGKTPAADTPKKNCLAGLDDKAIEQKVTELVKESI
jgi:hypothetical protein